ncbi:ATP-dependent helicase [Corynebacterium bovis]|uniref:ATP-dependent helicase DinG n=6 Tax=Corynebacterium bovis TaxID=36808 RepID=A0A3R8QJA2_9CORY|nr:ATP-dependent helicase [Corynebacterium bovis]RRQ07543.1 ATP-dependent helicase [Corynebacterium bovis]RRQ10393.1 ATP-dependent helicase [Corynebacterium bovis]
MTTAVAAALEGDSHLAVQAGTGTGKSLAYLVPSLRHAVQAGERVVVSTATIALQRQLVERDLPRVTDALAEGLGRRPTFAILKGRNNYLCLNKINGMPDPVDDAEALLDPSAVSRVGSQVARLHEWAEETEDGDRDSLARGVVDQAWRQVSVASRECVGASRCPFGDTCFAERARATAAEADVVVTNHALLAIDALSDQPVLPEHEVVVVDEAHELERRITSVATAELSGAAVAVLARRCAKVGPEGCSDALTEAGDTWVSAVEHVGDAAVGRWTSVPPDLHAPLVALRDALWRTRLSLTGRGGAGAAGGGTGSGGDAADASRTAEIHACTAALEELHDTVVRVLDSSPVAAGGAGAAGSATTAGAPGSGADTASPAATPGSPAATPGDADSLWGEDVVWLSGDAHRRTVRVAPLSVADVLRRRLFSRRSVVLTSATLALGGRFAAMLATWGLSADACRTMDVGSPFDPARHGILYTARHLPAPGRGGPTPEAVDELARLVNAAGGRTLGLFSSRRAAEEMAAQIRQVSPYPVLCQGDDALGALIDRFRDEEQTCLFGTLSLWQGVDVPGPSLSLVVMDRIPFPRPDDPLMQARKEAADSAGRNGFMEVAATHAALLMAQGAGRLLRSVTDRGVVAVLDPRLSTARYGRFLRASMPPFWPTEDAGTVRGALRRLVGPESGTGGPAAT